MSRVPIALIYSRLILGFFVSGVSLARVDGYRFIAITLFSIGLLTDILEGIIARRLKTSTQKLRRLDSTVDQVFFVSFVVATFVQCPGFFKANLTKLLILLGLESLTYIVSFIKFKKEIATHSIGAKIWTLFLFATLIQVTIECQSYMLFNFCFWIGILTRLEIVAIIVTLKKWTNDVPTLYHSLQLRNDKKIKRHKLFNG